jgi:hypothetical protein
MPKYFDTFGLKEPTDRLNTAFVFARGGLGKTVWEVTNSDSESMETFMLAMDGMESNWPTLGSYSLDWIVPKVAEFPERPLVVDVGGGKGHCLKIMCNVTPGLPMSRCILEDLPAVLDGAKKMGDAQLSAAQFVPVDFHAEQPVKGESLYPPSVHNSSQHVFVMRAYALTRPAGALVYFMRRCLHDYGDKDCVEMLQHLADAMAADSKLLIVEQVMNNPPDALGAAADILMAAIGGKERTLENWQEVIGEAGLRIQGVFRNPGVGALLECIKA